MAASTAGVGRVLGPSQAEAASEDAHKHCIYSRRYIDANNAKKKLAKIFLENIFQVIFLGVFFHMEHVFEHFGAF